ncbi:glycoside hydrolase family 68 protein [Aurantiacibacter marinus]|uniref:Levansucrase n=1 Tax=Aurantiacibacter marinus TaxID=874156 RepID=A0A0H0XR86_9SPHN|nr:glycoside hydrolase family 68 protein [Aurantiacibacter marinus]KLI65138.1 levansucrase [Aurantiacibacter marinus]
MTKSWTAQMLDGLQLGSTNQAPVLDADQARPMSPELDVWDAWPLADAGGQPVAWKGGELWFALSVPRSEDPEQRHHLARIHHFHRIGDTFQHVGSTFPDGFTPGAREWSGSARLVEGNVTMFFTAAGERGDTQLSYKQRLFSSSTTWLDGDAPFSQWSIPEEIFTADGEVYRPADQNEGEPGKIKAFRDPAHYRDAGGNDFVLFTGSSASKPGAHDGVIGLAAAIEGGGYRLSAPLIDASGVNNELERPHIVEHAGRLYLFWSTQRGVFAPGVEAPTGLYGATAETLAGPWDLLNGSGLVVANPAECPTQAYSWWVLPDLTVASFIDYWGPEDRSSSELHTRRARFGGTFAPFLQIALEGNRSQLVHGG